MISNVTNRLLLVLALLWSALACGPQDVSTTTLVLGTGESRFESLTQGQEVTLVRGPQGGVHLWMSLQATGLNPQKVWLDVGTTLGEVHQDTRNITQLQSQGERAELVGWPVILDESVLVDGSVLQLHVVVTDETGESANGHIQVRVKLPAQAANG